MNTGPASLIPCHCCGREARLVRSVLIWFDTTAEGEAMVQRFGRSFCPSDLSPADRAAFFAMERQYVRNSKHRRAFACEPCYHKLDNAAGSFALMGHAEIIGPNGPKRYGLAGVSRDGKAAVYDHRKWLRFQRNLASKMGVDLTV